MDFTNIEALIKDGEFAKAQSELDNITLRNGAWHYYQSIIYYKRNWLFESQNHLNIAISLDPENFKYQESMTRLSSLLSNPNHFSSLKKKDKTINNNPFEQGYPPYSSQSKSSYIPPPYSSDSPYNSTPFGYAPFLSQSQYYSAPPPRPYKKKRNWGFLAGVIIFGFIFLVLFIPFVAFGDLIFPMYTIDDTIEFNATVSHVEGFFGSPRVHLNEYDFYLRLPFYFSEEYYYRVFDLSNGEDIIFRVERRWFEWDTRSGSLIIVELRTGTEVILDIQSFYDNERRLRRDRIVAISLPSGAALIGSSIFLLFLIKPWERAPKTMKRSIS